MLISVLAYFPGNSTCNTTLRCFKKRDFIPGIKPQKYWVDGGAERGRWMFSRSQEEASTAQVGSLCCVLTSLKKRPHTEHLLKWESMTLYVMIHGHSPRLWYLLFISGNVIEIFFPIIFQIFHDNISIHSYHRKRILLLAYYSVVCVCVSHSVMSDSSNQGTVTHQAPLAMEFYRQEYWNGLPFGSPGDPPNPGIEPRSPALQADSLPSEPPILVGKGNSRGSH